LDIGTALPPVVLAPSSADFAPDQQKYPIDDINEPTPCTLLYVKVRTLRTIEVVDAIVMATRIMHGRPILLECVVVEVTTIKEGHEFQDLDYPDEEEGIEKLKDAKGNFILWPHKDIIRKICPSLIVLHQGREDEGTPTSQNTICSTAAFTPSQNPPKTTPPPKNPPSTQPLEHHSRHTTPLQNPPTEQAPQQYSPPHIHSLKSPHTTPPLQNPPTKQAAQQRSPPHVHSLKPPHTTPPLENPPTEQAPQQRSPPHVHSLKPPHTTLLFKIHKLNKLLNSVLLHMFILRSLLLTLPLLFKIHQMLQRSRMPLWMKPGKILRLYWTNFMMDLTIIKPRNC
jgi:hypothetical protein